MRYYFKIPLFKNSFLLSLHEMRGNSQPNEPLPQLTSSIGFIFLIIYTGRAPPLWALAGLDSSCFYRILFFFFCCTDENGTCLSNEQNLTVTMITIKMRPSPAADPQKHQRSHIKLIQSDDKCSQERVLAETTKRPGWSVRDCGVCPSPEQNDTCSISF